MFDSYPFTAKFNITNGAMGALLVILTVFLKHLYYTTVTFLQFGQEIFAIPTSYYSLRQVIVNEEKDIVKIGAACNLCDIVHWLADLDLIVYPENSGEIWKETWHAIHMGVLD